jgi:hypothetical protein
MRWACHSPASSARNRLQINAKGDGAVALRKEQSMKPVAIPTEIGAHEAFDRREPGWTKVIIETGG